MRVASILLLVTACLLLVASVATAKTPLGEALKDIDVADHWIYDDLPKAVAEAKSSGKPLMIVLRCVPCPPGRSLDAKVMQPAGELADVEKQFVCVRIIQTNSLNLDLFQYDYDMSWSAMFMSADGAIYGRYGTRSAGGPGSDKHLSPVGFRLAAERALALHDDYPANREQLAGKRGEPGEYRRPTEIPGLTDRPATATTRQNCIHCHMVKDYAIRAKWEAGRLTEKDLWVYPMPQQIGMTMDDEQGLKVKSVESGSPAGKAGIAAGDELVSISGQPLISLADIQWVLHNTPSDAELAVVVSRNGATQSKTLSLSGDWKKADIAWRPSTWYGLRQGVKIEPLTAQEKAARGLDAEQLALQVKGLFGKGGPKLKQAGLRQNDVIVAVDGKTDAMTETDFLVYLRLERGPKDRITFSVLRDGGRSDVTLPVW
ncbi:MAG: Trx7/PDZ domain-containing (seleno)protein [Pirellulaceae bacterium]